MLRAPVRGHAALNDGRLQEARFDSPRRSFHCSIRCGDLNSRHPAGCPQSATVSHMSTMLSVFLQLWSGLCRKKTTFVTHRIRQNTPFGDPKHKNNFWGGRTDPSQGLPWWGRGHPHYLVFLYIAKWLCIHTCYSHNRTH